MISRTLRLTHATRTHSFRRQTLAAACSAALLGLAFCSTAIAQDTQPATATGTTSSKAPAPKKNAEKKPADKQNAQNLNAVIVTGIAGSIENSLRTKKNSNEIVEAISAEDIGKLPDASIAESLSRLPGLATQRLDGRANMISIRGFSPDFSGTLLNGREQATVGENRGVDFDQYPSELISGAVVYKTPDATLIGQGLSGTVDLHTIRPLDQPGRVITANVRGEYTTNGDLNPGTDVGTLGHRASISYVDQFFDHTLGLAVGFAQLDSPIQNKRYNYWWWNADNGPIGMNQNWGAPLTPGLPDNVVNQQGMELDAQSQTQRRNGLMAVLEWAPSEHTHSTLDMYYSTFDNKKYTNDAQWSNNPWDNVAFSNAGITSALPYPIVTSGTISGIKPILQNQYHHEHDKLFSVGWNNQFFFDNGWTATTDLSYSGTRDKVRDIQMYMGLPPGTTASVDFNTPTGFDFPNLSPSVNLADPNMVGFTDPGGYGRNGREEFDRQTDTIRAVRFEVSHPLGWIFSDFVLGANYSQRIKRKNADVFFAWLNGNGSSNTSTLPYDSNFFAPITGFVGRPTRLNFGGIPGILYYNVAEALQNQFYLTEANGAGDWSRNYSITENVPVGYVKFNIDTNVGNVPVTGNVGVQVVHTNQSSRALQTDNNGDAIGTLSGGISYTNWLPSLNLVFHLTDRQDIRFGFAKTLARGRIDDEKVASSAWVSKITQGPAAGQVLWAGSGGNPKLKPYVAVGTDLSYEFYFGKSSYFAAAVFNKNLLNYIATQTELNHDFTGYVNNDPTLTPTSNIGSFTMPMNGSGGKMQGLELSGSLEGGLLADALDGFGAQANFSLTNSTVSQKVIGSIPGGAGSPPTTLPGLSRKVANLTLFYEKYGWSIRVAERYRSSFTGEIVPNFNQIAYTKVIPNRQTDLQLGYAFDAGKWKGLTLLLQVSNLTNSPDAKVQVSGLADGEQLTMPQYYDTYGRTVLLGASYKL
ncbi:MAG: TonB-dependent receptor [Rhodanobacter sp.]|nr:MAG: TonB-dependent receptor [Rhodanobacter sp.]TAM08202.1 MAG: TonB-dependent receptor [Rhodanobacter sp.]TAM36064.1 MAG: TonB-dependent receptor [Rhodanobacter sp.]